MNNIVIGLIFLNNPPTSNLTCYRRKHDSIVCTVLYLNTFLTDDGMWDMEENCAQIMFFFLNLIKR